MTHARPPQWTKEAGQVSTLVLRDYRCRVWLEQNGGWGASVRHGILATATYNFTTPEDAQRWCERQMAEQRMQCRVSRISISGAHQQLDDVLGQA